MKTTASHVLTIIGIVLLAFGVLTIADILLDAILDVWLSLLLGSTAFYAGYRLRD